MLTASELATSALSFESVATDPLEFLMQLGERDGSGWALVASIGDLKIFVAGEPVRGIILCHEQGERRECIRLRPDGVRTCTIVGKRHPMREPEPRSNRIDTAIDQAFAAVDGVGVTR